MLKTLITKYRFLLTAIAAVGIFTLGWVAHGWKVDSETLREQEAVVQLSHESIKKSDEIETKALDEKAKVEIKYRTIEKEVVKYVPQTVYDKCVASDGTVVPTTLSVGAVSLLNSDEADAGVQSSGISDEESAAPTEIGLQELSQYIAVIKEQYDKLAIDHNALVDYNTWYQDQVTPKP
jgi:hypothetical protein